MILGDAVSKLDVCMDFESYFKVPNLVSVHPKSIMLGQMVISCGGVSLLMG